jgi:acetylornithine deacetylase/succinyl-diaminopimelate desuccinylase-like protein
MIAIDSVTGNEGPMAEFCADWLRGKGIETTLQPCKDRFNTIGVVGNGGADAETLIISGHLDTVPPNEGEWTYGPHTPTVADGKIWGLGASDLHASIAGSYLASVYLADCDLPGRYMTAFTIEEETTGDGTIGFLDWAEKESFLDFSKTSAIVTEPTSFKQICLGNRGSSFVVVRVKGLGGHGSRPHLAKNPLPKIMQIVGRLSALQEEWKAKYSDPEFGFTTLTPTSINSGDLDRSNVIPEMAQAVIDCRPTPAVFANDLKIFREGVGAAIASCAEEGFEITWEELYPREGQKLDASHPLAQMTMDVVTNDLGLETEFAYTPAGNDAVFLALKGIPAVNKVGPGHPELAHRVNEHVTIENLLKGVELFIWLGLRHFGREPK